jgi:phosphopantetheine adenylyltransferase
MTQYLPLTITLTGAYKITLTGAYKINQLRVENGFKPLVILVSRRSGGATMSSSFIRERTLSEGEGNERSLC